MKKNRYMNKIIIIGIFTFICSLVITPLIHATSQLPPPQNIDMNLEQTIFRRMSVREFTNEPITDEQLATILWNAMGVRQDGDRTIAGVNGTFASIIYVLKEDAAYIYNPINHSLNLYKSGDWRDTVGYQFPTAPLVLGLCYNTTFANPHNAGVEIGEICQNIAFTVNALDLGAVVTGGLYAACARETLLRLREPGMLGGEPLARLVNTHCHSDHIGGNAAVARAYGCPITIPRDEVPTIDDWTIQERWNAYVDQYAEPFAYRDTIAAGESFRAADREWQAHAAPGHDMEGLVFFAPEGRILLSGDALWADGLGFVWAHDPPNPFVEAALEALDTIERLRPRVVIPGHGEPFEDVAGALAKARSRLAAFANDPKRTARHMMKVMFVFSMLHRGGVAVAEANAYVARVPCYRDLDERFLEEGIDGLGVRLVTDLERAGAMRVDDGFARPTMAR